MLAAQPPTTAATSKGTKGAKWRGSRNVSKPTATTKCWAELWSTAAAVQWADGSSKPRQSARQYYQPLTRGWPVSASPYEWPCNAPAESAAVAGLGASLDTIGAWSVKCFCGHCTAASSICCGVKYIGPACGSSQRYASTACSSSSSSSTV